MEICSFTSDEEKMRDFVELTKEEFLFSYSYLTEEEYDATLKDYCLNYIADGYITNFVIAAIELEESKLAQRVCRSMENLYQTNNLSIIKRGSVYYFEYELHSRKSMPDYVWNYLKSFMPKAFGLQYL